MRQFKIIINWPSANHVDEVTHVFAPGLDKDVTADAFLSMMLAGVSKAFSECDAATVSYIEENLFDVDYMAIMGDGIIESVEEIDA